MPSYKLTYFDMAGAAESVRYIFAYAGQSYEDIRVKMENWAALKPTVEFGKLPILEVDGKVFNQSNAMVRYLARQFGLTGKTELEAFKADALVDTLGDLKQEVYRIFREQDETKKQELQKVLTETTIPFYLSKFEKIVAANPSGFLVGSQITYADIVFTTTLSSMEEKQAGLLKPYPSLTGLVKKVQSIPSIKAWIAKSSK